MNNNTNDTNTITSCMLIFDMINIHIIAILNTGIPIAIIICSLNSKYSFLN